MKRMLLLLAVLLAFGCTAIAQDAMSSSSNTQTTTTKSKKSKSSDMSQSGDMSGMKHDTMGKGKMSGAKGSTLTGCISSTANADGMYTLSNGRYKKGVEIGPADKVKDHAGHQVSLTGKWSTAAAAGEMNASTKEKGEKHFEVEDVKHLSDTCKQAPGGGTMGAKKSGEMGDNMGKKSKKDKMGSDTSNPK